MINKKGMNPTLNPRYRVVERRNVIQAKGLTSDQTIQLTGAKAGNCPIRYLEKRLSYLANLAH